VAFTQKISEADISILYFEFFDNYQYLTPFCAVDNTVSTFVDLAFDLQLLPSNFDVGVELPVLSDSAYLKFRGCLHLLRLFAYRLSALEQGHVYRLEQLVVLEQFAILC
jgi:hypothetical protein